MGKKKKQYQMSLLAMVLADRGFIDILEEHTYLYASGPNFHVRADAERGVLEIGFAKTFDRWANSTDLTFHNPKWWDDGALEKLLDQVEERVPA